MVLLLVIVLASCVQESSKGRKKLGISEFTEEGEITGAGSSGPAPKSGAPQTGGRFYTGPNQRGIEKSCQERNDIVCAGDDGSLASYRANCQAIERRPVKCGCEEVICCNPKEEQEKEYVELYGVAESRNGAAYGLRINGSDSNWIELKFQQSQFQFEYSEGCPFRVYGYYNNENGITTLVAIEFELSFYQGWSFW